MAIKYGFFDSVDGDRLYSAEDISRYLQGIISSGVYADSSDSLQVLSAGGMQVQVQPGRAMLDCHYLENDSPLTLTLSPGGSMDRIDTIIMRLDMTNRLCEIVVVEGIPATSPAYMPLARNADTMEYMLASVYVTRLATAITQDKITDTRPDTYKCGYVTGVIKQVDTSTLWTQFDAACTERLQQFDAMLAGLAGDTGIDLHIKEYKRTVEITENTNVLAIGIPEYNPDTDVLFINVGGLIWTQNEYDLDYDTDPDTGAKSNFSILTYVTITAGYTVEFRVLKSHFGTGGGTVSASVENNILTLK